MACAILALLVGAMEIGLAQRGFQPTLLDSPQAWVAQRERVDALGERALILLGNSRMQLDVDTATMRQRTHLEPVQLAIDGASFMPILQGLADDPAVDGTVLVQYTDAALFDSPHGDAADDMQNAYDARAALPLNFDASEAWLTGLVRSHLRSYADGSRPVSALTDRLLATHPTPQYLYTRPDRSRFADYTRLAMPGAYFSRVIRNLDEEHVMRPGMSFRDMDEEVRRRIAALKPKPHAEFDHNLGDVEATVRSIQRRGGRVIFVVFPTTGLITATDDARYPRSVFWDRFVASTSAKTLRYDEIPTLARYRCPDGSHLDVREITGFTVDLASATGLDRPAR